MRYLPKPHMALANYSNNENAMDNDERKYFEGLHATLAAHTTFQLPEFVSEAPVSCSGCASVVHAGFVLPVGIFESDGEHEYKELPVMAPYCKACAGALAEFVRFVAVKGASA